MKSIGVVGATGVVGRTIVQILEEREFPVSRLFLFASAKSKGTTLDFRGEPVSVRTLGDSPDDALEIAFFAAGSAVSRKIVPDFVKRGTTVIDNSNAFRMEPDVPLVVPEVNREDIIGGASRIIANPNCSTIQLVVVLAPLHRHFRLKRAIVSTYQSVSGKGFKGVRELRSQQGGAEEASVFPQRIADNLIPFIDEIAGDGYCLEETKLMRETRKILKDETFHITATAVRVPIPHCHSESVNLEFDSDVRLAEVEEVLGSSAGVEYCGNSRIPSPADVVGTDAVWVGRLRRDRSQRNSLNLWIVADNLRKGAALNAVQIAEEVA